MSQYYGIQRSDEYLAHYGIRGMKWGMRKSVDGGTGRNTKAYNNAKKKLEKLQGAKPNKKEDFVEGFRKAANRPANIAGALALGAAGGTAGGAVAGAVGTMKYIKDHPKEYAAYKKKLKKMSFKDRMREGLRVNGIGR